MFWSHNEESKEAEDLEGAEFPSWKTSEIR